MKSTFGFSCLLALVSGLALAGCATGGPGATAVAPTAGLPAATAAPAQPTQPEAATPGPDTSTTAYPFGTPTPVPLPSAYPYPAASLPPPQIENKPADAALVDLAKKDLSQRLSVAADQIMVVSSVYMEWPDSSLGCPKAGFAYSQVITPGYRIVLQQAQKQYDYHTNLTDQLVLCTP